MPLRHRPLIRRLALASACGCLLGSLSLHASGTYPPAPPRLRADVVRNIDPEAYNLGKSIYSGRANFSSGTRADASLVENNAARLTTVVDRIPSRASAKLDVPRLAQQLDAASLDALIYYLELRFRLTEDSA
ncbi:hypothetical protein [Actomonas aquatica]|uniref:Uncharacterized protein n=1 Tax=Actomonas aquatica TaxID=2866162 RepID=A0ABZ1C8P0_9BACT|nr:hypothetical protein [Opitutus sp. WL0086]WRQ86934.1 hypothetical protein K1X11_019140 [Opitutus sp. WL0086]